MATRLDKAREIAIQRGPGFAVEVLVNFVGPYLIYGFAKHRLGDAGALMASSAPPILWSLIEFARHRRVDAVSILVLSGIALSLLAFLGGGGVKALQLREKLVSVAVALVFLGSVAIDRPLIFYLARAGMSRRPALGQSEDFERLSDHPVQALDARDDPGVGRRLLAEALLTGSLVFVLSIKQYLIVSPICGYATMGALALWTFWYVRRQRAKGRARRAAAEPVS